MINIGHLTINHIYIVYPTGNNYIIFYAPPRGGSTLPLFTQCTAPKYKRNDPPKSQTKGDTVGLIPIIERKTSRKP